jgi:hypothetical protein
LHPLACYGLVGRAIIADIIALKNKKIPIKFTPLLCSGRGYWDSKHGLKMKTADKGRLNAATTSFGNPATIAACRFWFIA